MIRRPPRSTQSRSSAASDVYKRQPLPEVGNRATAHHKRLPQDPNARGRGDTIPERRLHPTHRTTAVPRCYQQHLLRPRLSLLPTTGTPPHTVRQVDQGPQNRPRQANHPEDIGDADVLTQYPTSQEAQSHGRLPKACADGYHAPFVGPLLYFLVESHGAYYQADVGNSTQCEKGHGQPETPT